MPHPTWRSALACALWLSVPGAASAQGGLALDFCKVPRLPPWTRFEPLAGVPAAREGIVFSGANQGTDQLAKTALTLTVEAADGTTVPGSIDVWGLLGADHGEMLVAFRPAPPLVPGASYRAHVLADNAQLTGCPTSPPLDTSFEIAVAEEPLPPLPEPALAGLQWVQAWNRGAHTCCPLVDPAPCGGSGECEMCWEWLRAPALRPQWSEPLLEGPDLLYVVEFEHVGEDGQRTREGVFGTRHEPWRDETAFAIHDHGRHCATAELLRFRDRARTSRELCVPDLADDLDAEVLIAPDPAALANQRGVLMALDACASLPQLNPTQPLLERDGVHVWATFAAPKPKTAANTTAGSAGAGPEHDGPVTATGSQRCSAATQPTGSSGALLCVLAGLAWLRRRRGRQPLR